MSKLWVLFGAMSITILLLAKFLSGSVAPTLPETAAASAPLNQAIQSYIMNHPQVLLESIRQFRATERTQALVQMRPEIEKGFPGAVGGNPRGDVTIVEFFDFRCPFCRSAHAELSKIIAADPGVKIVYRDMPILDQPGQEPLSRSASKLALAAAKQGKYAAFYSAVFDTGGRVTREALIAAVRTAKLDETRIARDMNAADVSASLDANIRLANALGIDGTPGFVIGEQILVGAQQAEALTEAIARLRNQRTAPGAPAASAAPLQTVTP